MIRGRLMWRSSSVYIAVDNLVVLRLVDDSVDTLDSMVDI